MRFLNATRDLYIYVLQIDLFFRDAKTNIVVELFDVFIDMNKFMNDFDSNDENNNINDFNDFDDFNLDDNFNNDFNDDNYFDDFDDNIDDDDSYNDEINNDIDYDDNDVDNNNNVNNNEIEDNNASLINTRDKVKKRRKNYNEFKEKMFVYNKKRILTSFDLVCVSR
jgi:hypothetical protein